MLQAVERYELDVHSDEPWGADRIAVGTWRWAGSNCGHVSVWRDELLIFPRASSLPMAPADMPPNVAELYNEAREVMPVSRRAGAALARATLELLVKDLYPGQDGSLAARLDLIIPTVPTPLGSMLTLIRHVGNKTLHVEEAPDDATVLVLDPADEDLVNLMFESINELVDEAITKPARAKKYLDLVPENVKKNVKGLEQQT